MRIIRTIRIMLYYSRKYLEKVLQTIIIHETETQSIRFHTFSWRDGISEVDEVDEFDGGIDGDGNGDGDGDGDGDIIIFMGIVTSRLSRVREHLPSGEAHCMMWSSSPSKLTSHAKLLHVDFTLCCQKYAS